MTFLASQAAAMSRRLHAIQAAARRDSAAARLLPSAAVNAAVYLASHMSADASDAELKSVLDLYERSVPVAFAPPGTIVCPPAPLSPTSRAEFAQTKTAEGRLALANRLAEAAKPARKP